MLSSDHCVNMISLLILFHPTKNTLSMGREGESNCTFFFVKSHASKKNNMHLALNFNLVGKQNNAVFTLGLPCMAPP